VGKLNKWEASYSGKINVALWILFRDLKNQTCYMGKLLMRGLFSRVLLYLKLFENGNASEGHNKCSHYNKLNLIKLRNSSPWAFVAGIQCIDSRNEDFCDLLANMILVIFNVHDSDDYLGALT
jgi:hypothetical protein